MEFSFIYTLYILMRGIISENAGAFFKKNLTSGGLGFIFNTQKCNRIKFLRISAES